MPNEHSQPIRFEDDRGGCGLHLRVTQNADGVTRTFHQSVPLHGEQPAVKIGTYPKVTLSEAREKAIANLKRVRDEENPTGNQAA